MASPTPEASMDHLDTTCATGVATAPTGEQLRALAALETQYRQLLDALEDKQLTAAQSLAFLRITDATRRTAYYAMIRASGAVTATQAHRLSQTALEHAISQDTGQIAAGAPLAVNQLLPAGTKSHYRSEVELIARVADLRIHSAKALVKSHRQLVGSAGRPAQFKVLARRFASPDQNPEVVAQAAARISSLQLRGRALARAESRVAQSTTQGQSAVAAELKSLSDELSAPDLPEREVVHERCAGLRYRGLGPRGHVWELTCTTVDHEFLSTLADRLVNPKLAANRQGTSFSAGELPADAVTAPEDEYNDPASVKARKLLHTLVEILRRHAGAQRTARASRTAAQPTRSTADTDAPQPVGTPDESAGTGGKCADAEPVGLVLPPMIDLIVTIDYDALRGATDAAGITSHGQRISATALRQSAAIAGIIPEVLGGDGEILDYGRRRRLFTTAQTRAVVGRDRGCINPGCTMPAHRCEVNHIKPWHRGGKTCTDNGCLLCKGCHMAFHAGHFRIKLINGVPYVLQSRDRDPEQLWRRNWVWYPQAEALAA
ncbi:HNH endonuclease [Glutamicibacter sp. MNS18]|uniref:HNH endonuclease signature motif containing protein n=1 Tax=Glutamicibacter sp. MNS18 TaxID=2989817 RepID=UPI0022365CBE|nr:HNH endonuclease signature motif containing protein [Glutamicibacter sp. MNS18]MCW4467179.1 HNH endonuclease [Glutamicibacter sp. MNS18]